MGLYASFSDHVGPSGLSSTDDPGGGEPAAHLVGGREIAAGAGILPLRQ